MVIRNAVPHDGRLSIIYRLDTKRVELCDDYNYFKRLQIPHKIFNHIDTAAAIWPVEIENIGQLHKEVAKTEVHIDSHAIIENSKARKYLHIAWMLPLLLFITQTIYMALRTVEKEEQIVVKIEQKKPAVKKAKQKIVKARKTRKKRARNLKRMGILASLGERKIKSNTSGLRINKANVSDGPGLGGSQGSGGVQRSVYAKGISSAPLGAGMNLSGAGGYGTKGKGGGKAGYGRSSLIGSSGSQSIPLDDQAFAEEGLDMDAIAEVIQRNIGQVRKCYEKGLKGNAALGGRVAVKFVISPKGRVNTAGIGSSSINSNIVEHCILQHLKRWKFPLPDGGVFVKVSYPFLLKRVGRG